MEIFNMILKYVIVFAIGGLFCAAAQLILVKTKITPARILVLFLVLGIGLEAFGVYKYMLTFAKAGVSTPIIGFGALLAKGAIETARKVGFVGAFSGGLIYSAYGVGIAVVASFLITLVFSPKTK